MRRLFLIGALFFCLIQGFARSDYQIISPQRSHNATVALIVDTKTFQQTAAAIRAYRDAIEADGLSVYILIADWASPDSVKQAIRKLYQETHRFQGVAFVGDIPIPMIRDAQHLTSAFKMIQERFPLEISSVPSDRFYDDFDLQFEFLAQDTTQPLLFYYTLKPDSPQRISKEIYSARIYPPQRDSSRYASLRHYLSRIAAQKSGLKPIDNMLVYTGHGYHSEALAAWEGEALSLREQFPQLYQPGGHFTHINFRFEQQIKSFLISQIQKPGLDVAIFHSHGLPLRQAISGYPHPINMQQAVTYLQRSLRHRLRRAKRWDRDLVAAQTYYQEKYGVPEDWFEGAFLDSVIQSDSLYSASLDIHTADVRNLEPHPLFIIFDECFNAHYIEPDYIVGNYVMGKGKTIVAAGNTVNVKQDIWANELIGLLNYGLRIGAWHQNNCYLESHLIGDPFFHFKDLHDQHISRILAKKQYDIRYWKWMARHAEAPLRVLAIAQLHAWLGTKYDAQLADIYHHDASFNVRMQALKCLADSRSEIFENLLPEAVNDPYELIRRIAAMWMGEIGHVHYIPFLFEKALYESSSRVRLSATSALKFIGPDTVLAALPDYLNTLTGSVYQNNLDILNHHLNYNQGRLHDDLIPALKSDTLSMKQRIGAVRNFRNYNFHQAVTPLITLALNPAEPAELRQKTLEALGWFYFSYRRPEIEQACEEIHTQEELPAIVAAEALKTLNRLREGPNNPITP